MHDYAQSVHENFKPRLFKARFLAKNELICGSIYLLMIENDAKVSHNKTSIRRGFHVITSY